MSVFYNTPKCILSIGTWPTISFGSADTAFPDGDMASACWRNTWFSDSELESFSSNLSYKRWTNFFKKILCLWRWMKSCIDEGPLKSAFPIDWVLDEGRWNIFYHFFCLAHYLAIVVHFLYIFCAGSPYWQTSFFIEYIILFIKKLNDSELTHLWIESWSWFALWSASSSFLTSSAFLASASIFAFLSSSAAALLSDSNNACISNRSSSCQLIPQVQPFSIIRKWFPNVPLNMLYQSMAIWYTIVLYCSI